jgi:hypothetical protein
MKYKTLKAILFWIWQLTWGSLFTIPGLIITGVLILFGGKVHKNGFSYIVEIGNNWGGLALGAVSLCGRYSDTNHDFFEHVRRHEFGHNVQQLILGPLQILLISIPSAIRYWYFRLTPDKIHQDYDYVIFEYTASKWGYEWINKIENKELAYTYRRIKK